MQRRRAWVCWKSLQKIPLILLSSWQRKRKSGTESRHENEFGCCVCVCVCVPNVYLFACWLYCNHTERQVVEYFNSQGLFCNYLYFYCFSLHFSLRLFMFIKLSSSEARAQSYCVCKWLYCAYFYGIFAGKMSLLTLTKETDCIVLYFLTLLSCLSSKCVR